MDNKATVTAEPGRQEIVIIREFDAPREKVFDAYIKPDLYQQWVGPRKYRMMLEKFEAKDGGSWRYISKDDDGNEFGFHGVNHEVKYPERLIGTFEFEGLPESGHVSLERAEFEELPDGRTKVTTTSVFLSQEDRDGMVQSGMEEGLNESYERLDELLQRI